MNASNQPDHDLRFRFARRRYLLACGALLLLLAASAASARLHMGVGNLMAGVGIALVKAAIVAWIFMGLRESGILPRIAAAAGVAALLVLGSLSMADFMPRHNETASWQTPQLVSARLVQQHGPASSSPTLSAQPAKANTP